MTICGPRLPVLLLLVNLETSPAAAQQIANAEARYGAHTGYQFGENWFAGPQLFWPLSSIVDLYPSFDYLLRSGSTAWIMNLDVKAHSPDPNLSWYFGTGLAYYHSSTEASSFSSTGLNLFTGLEGQSGGALLPYVEVRLIIAEGGGAYRVGGGLNWH